MSFIVTLRECVLLLLGGGPLCLLLHEALPRPSEHQHSLAGPRELESEIRMHFCGSEVLGLLHRFWNWCFVVYLSSHVYIVASIAFLQLSRKSYFDITARADSNIAARDIVLKGIGSRSFC